MALRSALRRAGAASPLVPALLYAGAIVVANLLGGLAPDSVPAAILVLLLWAAATLFLFVVVTWYRDDDWLAAGFLIGVTITLSAWVADALLGVLATGSLGGAILGAAGATLALIVRGVILVPLCGGAVALARWLTRRRRAATPGAPPA